MNVDESAPVVASGEIEVEADVETVWEVLTDIESWPRWNPDVRWASLKGELAEGSAFRWKTGPGTITATLRRVERPRLVGWTGKTIGIEAVHVWWLEPRDGATAVRTAESWAGLMPRLFPGPMRRILEKAIQAGLGFLKAEAERRPPR